jgi:hypothetical protein
MLHLALILQLYLALNVTIFKMRFSHGTTLTEKVLSHYYQQYL